ncbi:hypothetical protein GCM10020331_054840 [Ectobacillus funiculus]
MSTVAALSLAACSNTTNQGTTQKKQEASAQTQQQKNQRLPQHFYYTANEGGSISKIDATTNKVVETIQVEGAVHNVQVSPDGKVIAATVVPNMESGDHDSMEMNGLVSFYDTSSNKLLKTVEVGEHPAHVVFTQDGKYVLVTNNEGNDVSILDGKTYEAIKKCCSRKRTSWIPYFK